MIPFTPQILTTDVLVWLLVATFAGFAVYVRHHKHLLAPWRRVVQNTSGMVAFTVLSLFVVVGLLDSLHYRALVGEHDGKPVYAVEVLSVLDKITETLRTREEKTYSAPFAAYLYAKETIENPEGQAITIRAYPRLLYGGAHLSNPDKELTGDVMRRGLRGVGVGAVIWLALCVVLCLLLGRRREGGLRVAWREIWAGETEVPWRAVLIALAVILAVATPLVKLSAYYHVFGTDKVGQDVFYLALKSVRTGLVIGTLTTLVMLPFAILLGTMAGYFKGWVDDLIQYLYTTLNSIPGILLIAAAVLMMQVYIETNSERFASTIERADFRLLWLCLILGVTTWTGLCRLLRAETLKIREMEYIQAAQAFGVSHLRILARHVVPNVMHLVLIAVVLDFSGLVLAEAVLAYIGVGVDPSMNSFGGMINSARLEMAREPMVWWLLAAAFTFMLLIVLSANLLADAVRDAFDPRVRGRTLSVERLRELASEDA